MGTRFRFCNVALRPFSHLEGDKKGMREWLRRQEIWEWNPETQRYSRVRVYGWVWFPVEPGEKLAIVPTRWG